MPSANARLHAVRQQKKDDMGMSTEVQTQQQSPQPDFIICSRIIYLCRLTNQLYAVIIGSLTNVFIGVTKEALG